MTARPPYELVVIGASWGGMQALRRLLLDLPGDLASCVCVVQHRGIGGWNAGYAEMLCGECSLTVTEADDKQPLEDGKVFLAPADYHLLVEDHRLALSCDERVRYARPSIDVLFESAAESHPGRVLGVVLTGANDDGAAGLRAIKASGGHAIVQSPDDAERPEMPRAAIATGVVDDVLPLAAIGARITELCGTTGELGQAGAREQRHG